MPDSTGRVKWRPYYDQEELDYECERLVTSFLKGRYGEIRFPIATDDLSVMIEQETSDLDLYADLSVEGEDVEGLTEFYPDRKPAVKIALGLSLDLLRASRLRTTLAHEYGHVRFHSFLWDDVSPIKKPTTGILNKIPVQRRKYEEFRERLASRHALQISCPASTNNIPTAIRTNYESVFKCKQSRIVDAPFSDWMEWQASYASGAILMPLSYLSKLLRPEQCKFAQSGALPCDSQQAGERILHVSGFFDVSVDAARVRLEKLGLIQRQAGPALSLQ